MKPFYCSIFEIWDINTFEDYKDTISNKYTKLMVSSLWDTPYYKHTSYETILLQRFKKWDIIRFRGV